MQAIILCGGLATRLKPLTKSTPKSMILVHGKPFLEHQLRLLKKNGITDIVLSVGHMAEAIKGYFKDGRVLGVRIRYIQDGHRLLGTAGALKKALPLLRKQFFVLDGDSYLPVNYLSVMKRFKKNRKPALMVVYKNRNRYDKSNVVIEGQSVKRYDRKHPDPKKIYIHIGLSVLDKSVLALIPKNRRYSQGELWPRLIARGELAAFETKKRFYEIGSLRGLAELRRLADKGEINP